MEIPRNWVQSRAKLAPGAGKTGRPCLGVLHEAPAVRGATFFTVWTAKNVALRTAGAASRKPGQQVNGEWECTSLGVHDVMDAVHGAMGAVHVVMGAVQDVTGAVHDGMAAFW